MKMKKKYFKTFRRTFWVQIGFIGRSIIDTALLKDTGQYVNKYVSQHKICIDFDPQLHFGEVIQRRQSTG